MVSLANHFRPTFRADAVNTALTCNVGFFVSTLGVWANTVAAWAGAGFVATAPSTAALPAFSRPSKSLILHHIISLFFEVVRGTGF
jgi:hypothetical protein